MNSSNQVIAGLGYFWKLFIEELSYNAATMRESFQFLFFTSISGSSIIIKGWKVCSGKNDLVLPLFDS